MSSRENRAAAVGWSVLRQSRVLVSLTVVALVFLVGGILAGQLLSAPTSQRAPLRAGVITEVVEARQLRATVTARADISFALPADVNPALPDGITRPVVTGRVPRPGDMVKSGSVLLEVSGRPLFVLAGRFPAYRSFAPGVSGPDVTMLRRALKVLGYDVGADRDSYDPALSAAVSRLYADHGYRLPGDANTARLAVRGAEDGLYDAKLSARDAQRSKTKARAAVTAAEADLTKLEAARAASHDAAADQAVTDAKAALADAREGVTQAAEGLATANRAVARAQEALAAAKRDALTSLPISEVAFLTQLPRRVDEVNLALGTVIGETPVGADSASHAAIVLSSSKITVTAAVSPQEASLLKLGARAHLIGPGGEDLPASVSSICPEAGAGNSTSDDTQDCLVGIKLGELGDLKQADLVGNLAVRIDVGASKPDSLAVPVAAVSADAAGHARVQRILAGAQNQNPPDLASLVWVSITPGISADGYVEVKASTPQLQAGDLVTVGIADGDRGTDPAPAVSPDEKHG